MNDLTENGVRGTMFYDGTCRFCTGSANRLRPWLKEKSIEVVPFENGAEQAEMLVTWHDGREFGGADAVLMLARQFWFAAPFAVVAGLPGLKQLTSAGYRFVARNRHCANGTCALKPAQKPVWLEWLVLGALIAAAVGTGIAFPMPAWIWMWNIAGALWLGFKFMNFRAEGGFARISPLFLAWVGTDACAFRDDRKPVRSHELPVSGLLFVVVGAILLLAVLPRIEGPIAVGWIGVAAMLSLFHFGAFELLASVWRRLGFPVEPIMQAPWKAKTLAELWGPRWNRAFSDWARLWIFRPLVRHLGTARGTFAGFFASGIAHELVISVPAQGGYGLPTAYFLLQAVGVLAQRKFSVLRNRLTTLGIVLLPAPILFHPIFIERVFAPMMEALLILENP